MGIISWIMFYSKVKDIKNRALLRKKEKSKLLKSLFFFNLMNRFKLKKKSVKLEKVLFAWRKLYSTNCVKLNSKTRVLRRCVVSNRNRGNLRSFGGLSRIVLRNFIHSGILPGYKKAVW